VPVAVEDATVKFTVDVPEPGAAIDVVLKPIVTPLGWPLAVKAIAELNPPETAVVIVDVPLLPSFTVIAVGEAEKVKAGVAADVTVRVTEAVCVIPPPVLAIVIG